MQSCGLTIIGFTNGRLLSFEILIPSFEIIIVSFGMQCSSYTYRIFSFEITLVSFEIQRVGISISNPSFPSNLFVDSVILILVGFVFSWLWSGCVVIPRR